MRSPEVRPGLRAAARVLALVLLLAAVALAPGAASAASPAPTQPAAGDPRSSGQGPGLVGDPLFAIGGVALIGLLAIGGTLLYVRATPREGRPR